MQSQDTIAELGSNSPHRSNPAPRTAHPDTPVCFPFWMTKQIALDLEEKLRLEQEVELLLLEQSAYKRLVTGLEQKDRNRKLQLELLEKNQELLEVQLKAERDIKNAETWLLGALRLLGALGAGFVLGRI